MLMNGKAENSMCPPQSASFLLHNQLDCNLFISGRQGHTTEFWPLKHGHNQAMPLLRLTPKIPLSFLHTLSPLKKETPRTKRGGVIRRTDSRSLICLSKGSYPQECSNKEYFCWNTTGMGNKLLLCWIIEIRQLFVIAVQLSSIAQWCLTLRPHGLQHVRPPCLSPTPRVYSNSCPLSRWCHPTISSSVIPFSFCLQSFPASGSFQMSQLFASVSGQSVGV